MPQDMIGKRALVTGAARGLGLAIANRLASGGARGWRLDPNDMIAKMVEVVPASEGRFRNVHRQFV